MDAVVVDTNVPVTANGRADHAGPDCQLACIRELNRTKGERLVVLDDAERILDEYRANLSMSGQPGTGDEFMLWIWQTQADPSHCEKVPITPRTADSDDFEEFPDDPALAGFDRSDRKFVAVAIASRSNPTVLNATDTGWWVFRRPLTKHGVRVRLVCPGLMQDRPRKRRSPARD